MNRLTREHYRLIFVWTPRALTALVVMLLAIFALDVFDGEQSFKESVLGFLIHIIPSYSLLVTLLIAWKRPLYGGFLLLVCALFFTAYFHTYREIFTFMIISVPIIIVGVLFILSYFLCKRQLNASDRKENPE